MSARERARLFQTALLDAVACCPTNDEPPVVVRHYLRGEQLMLQGKPATSIVALRIGFVKLLRGRSGGGTLVGIRGPGECLGEASVLDGRPYVVTVIALEPVQAFELPRQLVADILRGQPELMQLLLRTLASLQREGWRFAADLACLDLCERLASQLLTIAEAHGTPEGKAIALPRFTQEDLGAMMGASRETVSKHMQRLLASGALERHGRRIAVVDVERLRRACRKESRAPRARSRIA
ncbi:MAG: family transcriptional regulator, cyclic receptor protein [Chloroflexota bacterium]|jgi:CRP-like cAMP-binding protein|nr:family transcriptional regulator, cyclic receptor protein [Chloroflexota bacterium]